MREVKSVLLQLDEFDRWLVVTYWHWLLIRRGLRRVPLAGKMGVVTSLVIAAALVLAPPAHLLPPIFMPLLLAGAYTFSLTICILLPGRRLR